MTKILEYFKFGGRGGSGCCGFLTTSFIPLLSTDKGTCVETGVTSMGESSQAISMGRSRILSGVRSSKTLFSSKVTVLVGETTSLVTSLLWETGGKQNKKWH